MASISRSAPIHLGLDVHKDTISVGILPADQQIPDVERIAHDEASIRRLACRLGHPRMLRACYQHRPDRLRAGPAAAQHGDQLPGDRPVADPQSPRATRPETDRRDCRRLTAAAPRRRAGRHPHPDRPGGGGAGSLSHQRRHGPRPDPCPQPARQILAAPRAGVAGGATWTLTHQAWLGSQRFDQPAMAQTFGHDLAVVEVGNVQPDAVEADLAGWCDRAPLDSAGRPAGRLPRGHPAGRAEVGRSRSLGWRRFATASHLMGFCGLVPSELLQRHQRPPRPAHQGRQWAPARPAGPGRPGPCSIAPASACRSPAASRALNPRLLPGRGQPSSACAPASGSWQPASTSSPSWRPRSPGSSPGSCGPR